MKLRVKKSQIGCCQLSSLFVMSCAQSTNYTSTWKLQFQISLLNDLAIFLNFTYEIVPPSDGGKWGGISKDGEGFGLVGDLKVKCKLKNKNLQKNK